MDSKEIVDALVSVARAAHGLADNTEENATTGEMNIMPSDFKNLSEALDKLDQMDDPPMEAATGPRKAEYWLEEVEKVETAKLRLRAALQCATPTGLS